MRLNAACESTIAWEATHRTMLFLELPHELEYDGSGHPQIYLAIFMEVMRDKYNHS